MECVTIPYNDTLKEKTLKYIKAAKNPIIIVKYARQISQNTKNSLEAHRYYDILINMHEGKIDNIKELSEINLLNILQYAGKHTEYYKNLFQRIHYDPNSLEGFETIPLLDKPIIRKNYNSLVSDELMKLNYYKMNTGGSTGEPLEFFVSSFAGSIDTVHQEFVFKKFMQYQKGDRIVAFCGSSVPKRDLDNHIYWIETSKNDIPYGRLAYSSLYLKPETINYYLSHILDTQPVILRGYPSFLSSIAEYILQKNISIPFNIKGIQLTAENAYLWQIENIKKAFNARIFFQYGHSEVCVYGYTYNEKYEYYCSPFYGYTEILDLKGKHVIPGEVGEVVVTGFYNYAMPFIRYRTGDMAVYAGNKDGIVHLAKISGRTQDYIITKNGDKVATTALIFGQHLHAFKNIQKWQLEQNLPGKVNVKIIKGFEYSSNDEFEIQKIFRDVCDIDTEFEYVGNIPLTPRGKFKFFIQNIDLSK